MAGFDGFIERAKNDLLRAERAIHRPSIEERILEQLQENNFLLRHLFRSLTSHRVLGGVMSRVGDSMKPITPGSSPKFAVTPTPDKVVTIAQNATWTSSNPLAPVTVDPTDPTGLTATVEIDPSVTVGSEIDLTWTYANADGSIATVTGAFPVVAPVPADVTGGTMAQID